MLQPSGDMPSFKKERKRERKKDCEIKREKLLTLRASEDIYSFFIQMKSVFYSLFLSLSLASFLFSLSLLFVFHSWNVTFLAQTCLHMFPLVTYVFWGKFPSSAKNSHVCSSHVPWEGRRAAPMWANLFTDADKLLSSCQQPCNSNS